MHVTGIYAALAALLIVALGLRVSLARRSFGVGIGDGGREPLSRRIRVHANAIETVPIALILLLILELNQTQRWLLHVFGIVLIVARLLHAFALSRHSGASTGRFLGTFLTWLLIGVMALFVLWQAAATWIIATQY